MTPLNKEKTDRWLKAHNLDLEDVVSPPGKAAPCVIEQAPSGRFVLAREVAHRFRDTSGLILLRPPLDPDADMPIILARLLMPGAEVDAGSFVANVSAVRFAAREEAALHTFLTTCLYLYRPVVCIPSHGKWTISLEAESHFIQAASSPDQLPFNEESLKGLAMEQFQ